MLRDIKGRMFNRGQIARFIAGPHAGIAIAIGTRDYRGRIGMSAINASDCFAIPRWITPAHASEIEITSQLSDAALSGLLYKFTVAIKIKVIKEDIEAHGDGRVLVWLQHGDGGQLALGFDHKGNATAARLEAYRNAYYNLMSPAQLIEEAKAVDLNETSKDIRIRRLSTLSTYLAETGPNGPSIASWQACACGKRAPRPIFDDRGRCPTCARAANIAAGFERARQQLDAAVEAGDWATYEAIRGAFYYE